MKPIRHNEVRAFFDGLADTWNAVVDPVKVRDMVSGVGIERGCTVLDVGSGTGVLIPFLLNAVGPEGKIYALDISPAMLERSKAKGFPNVEYVCAPVEKMPFSDGCFDAVLCFNSFPHFIEQATAVREMARVLVDGGRLVIAHLLSREALNECHSHLGGAIAHDLLPDDATMMSLVESAGLAGATIADGSSGYMLTAVKPSHTREKPTCFS